MKKIMVNSHERSGTHFLMNTIANNFGFLTHPWIDLDNPIYIPHVPNNMGAMLEAISQNEERKRAIVKSHYNGKFFEGILPALSKLYHIFYIYRESDPTLRSCWQHFKDIYEGHEDFDYSTGEMKRISGWNGGPVTNTPEEFAEAEPWGACMRYQYQQYPTMRERHADHVDSWLGHPEVIYVKYEDLKDDFENTVKAIQAEIDMPLFHGSIIKPTKANTIQKGKFSNEVKV